MVNELLTSWWLRSRERKLGRDDVRDPNALLKGTTLYDQLLGSTSNVLAPSQECNQLGRDQAFNP